MTILERLLGHDAWTTRQLLLRCRELSDEQLDRKFDIGDKSLRQTFVHMLECSELHLDRMLGRQERDVLEDYTVAALLKRQRAASKELADLALQAEREGRLDELWGDVKLTLGAGIVHVITHGMHHRAQAMYIMEKLGLKDVIEGDALGWESVARGWGWADGRSEGRPVSEWDWDD